MRSIKHLTALSAFFFLFSYITLAQQPGDITLGGFGELHYNDVIYDANGSQTPGELDFHRFNLIAGYDFNQWISLQSELALEHTLVNPVQGGEVALKQAYIDLNLQREFGIRAGLLLVPMGIINPSRRPTTFPGVERPNVERYIIPATWRESGLGIYGNTTFGLSYEAYAMAGLKPNGITGENGIRGARQHGFKSSTANMALTARVDYKIHPNITFGGSYYISTLENKIEKDNVERIPSLSGSIFNMGEGHILFSSDRFKIRGLFAFSRILDVEDLNRTFGNGAGQIQSGGYVELAYDILPFFMPLTKQQLFVFARGESYDTNFVASGIPRNNEFLREEFTLGLTYKPIPGVVFKADYQFLTSLASKYIQRLNAGVGFSF